MIHITSSQVHVYSFNPSVRFALGLDRYQKVATLGPYLNSQVHTYEILRGYLLGEILRANAVVSGSSDMAAFCIACLALEAKLLG